MSKEKLARRKKVGGPSNDPENVTYGRANPFMPQGPNNVDTDPRTAASFNAMMPSMNGTAQNPYGDYAIQSPALGAQSGQPTPAGGIASFSGNMQNTVPGTKLNQMPANMQPAFPQQGSAPNWDQQEAMRIGGEVQKRFGLFANAMGLANPGFPQSVVPGGGVPSNTQTPNTIPLQGVAGGLAQENKGAKNAKRGQRNEKGMAT